MYSDRNMSMLAEMEVIEIIRSQAYMREIMDLKLFNHRMCLVFNLKRNNYLTFIILSQFWPNCGAYLDLFPSGWRSSRLEFAWESGIRGEIGVSWLVLLLSPCLKSISSTYLLSLGHQPYNVKISSIYSLLPPQPLHSLKASDQLHSPLAQMFHYLEQIELQLSI